MQYSKQFEKFFADFKMTRVQIPLKYAIGGLKQPPKDRRFSTPAQYEQHLNEEIEFWQNLNSESPVINEYIKHLENALSYLNQASNSGDSWENDAQENCEYYLNESKSSAIQVPYSRTKLAQSFNDYKDKSIRFIKGFEHGATIEEIRIMPNAAYNLYPDTQSKDYYAGLNQGFEYARHIKLKDNISSAEQENIENTQTKFFNTVNEYEARFLEIQKSAEENIELHKNLSQNLMEQTNDDFETLRKTYEDKLILEAPAKYWGDLRKEYGFKGLVFMILSVIMAMLGIAIIAALVILISKFSVITDDAAWLSLFKITAGFTVATSIAVYTLKIFVKMAMSSYHLSRDAREREQLTYFYLSLIKRNAVTDNERELVLNSLFSRSNTGLIKGDDAPEFPLNLTDFMGKK